MGEGNCTADRKLRFQNQNQERDDGDEEHKGKYKNDDWKQSQNELKKLGNGENGSETSRIESK